MSDVISAQEENLYDILKNNILDLKLKPGMILSIKNICETYNIGRTPARDVLLQLSKDGLITFLPQRGTMISLIQLETAKNQRFLWECVEKVVLMESMAQRNINVITELELSIQRLEELYRSDQLYNREFLKEDRNFHFIFYKAANREYCYHMLEERTLDYYRVQLLALSDKSMQKKILEQHKEILDAFTSSDSTGLTIAFTRHIHQIISNDIVKQYIELFDTSSHFETKKPSILDMDFLAEAKLHYHL